MNRRILMQIGLSLALLAGWPAKAQTPPDVLVREVSTEVIETAKNDPAIQAGDIGRIMALVDTKILPHVNFERMTSKAVGRPWVQATPEQRQRLQEEFKRLLVRTYAGALAQVKNQTLHFKPLRAAPEDTEVIVRSEVRGGGGEPIQLDYRLEKGPNGWRIYDVNVMGVWLVANYQNTFKQEIGKSGIDGLINKLAEQNKSAASRS
jgi:phospholipid transport system substrate-binding protein